MASRAPKHMHTSASSGRWSPDNFPMALMKWKHAPKLGNWHFDYGGEGEIINNCNNDLYKLCDELNHLTSKKDESLENFVVIFINHYCSFSLKDCPLWRVISTHYFSFTWTWSISGWKIWIMYSYLFTTWLKFAWRI